MELIDKKLSTQKKTVVDILRLMILLPNLRRETININKHHKVTDISKVES